MSRCLGCEQTDGSLGKDQVSFWATGSASKRPWYLLSVPSSSNFVESGQVLFSFTHLFWGHRIEAKLTMLVLRISTISFHRIRHKALRKYNDALPWTDYFNGIAWKHVGWTTVHRSASVFHNFIKSDSSFS